MSHARGSTLARRSRHGTQARRAASPLALGTWIGRMARTWWIHASTYERRPEYSRSTASEVPCTEAQTPLGGHGAASELGSVSERLALVNGGVLRVAFNVHESNHIFQKLDTQILVRNNKYDWTVSAAPVTPHALLHRACPARHSRNGCGRRCTRSSKSQVTNDVRTATHQHRGGPTCTSGYSSVKIVRPLIVIWARRCRRYDLLRTTYGRAHTSSICALLGTKKATHTLCRHLSCFPHLSSRRRHRTSGSSMCGTSTSAWRSATRA